METLQKEYEKYMKQVTDAFVNMQSDKMQDKIFYEAVWKGGLEYSFEISGGLYIKGVTLEEMKSHNAEIAKKYLSENSLTYKKWLLKYKKGESLRMFTDSFGEKFDLDDDETYKFLPSDISVLDDLMFQEIGKALVYMKHFHPNWDEKQEARINVLIEEFAKNRKKYYISSFEDLRWYQEQVFIFQDETENMC